MRTPGIVRAVSALVCPLVVVASLGIGAPAWATPPALERARRQIDELQYDLARTSLTAALASGQASVDEMVELHRLTGEVAATLGDADAAQASFERALSLRPSTTLPEGVSPKIAEPFEAARAKLGDRRLVTTATLNPKTQSLVVEIKDDPAGLVAGARAVVIAADGTEQSVGARGKGKLELAIPAMSDGMHARVEIIDQAGNILSELDADESGGSMAGATDTSGLRDDGTGKPIHKQWWLWAGIGGVAAVAGVTFALSAKSAEDNLATLNERVREQPFSADYAEAQALEDKAKSRALGANIAFGLAGACAIAAAVLAFKGDDAPASDESTGPRATVTPTKGGATFAVGVSF